MLSGLLLRTSLLLEVEPNLFQCATLKKKMIGETIISFIADLNDCFALSPMKQSLFMTDSIGG